MSEPFFFRRSIFFFPYRVRAFRPTRSSSHLRKGHPPAQGEKKSFPIVSSAAHTGSKFGLFYRISHPLFDISIDLRNKNGLFTRAGRRIKGALLVELRLGFPPFQIAGVGQPFYKAHSSPFFFLENDPPPHCPARLSARPFSRSTRDRAAPLV